MPALSTDAVTLFEDLIRHEVEDKRIPSISYALVDRDGTLAEGHVQRSDRDFPMGPETCFRIGSITKSFTSMAIMQLVEQGKIDIDADIATYIPGFAPKNPFAGRESGPFGPTVTLRKLMSHTAGMVREPQSGHYLDDHRPPLEDTVAELAQSELKVDPSAGIMQYSNAGIAVVGLVIEKVSGLRYSDYVQRHIFDPLGMAHSASGMAPGIRDRLAPADMWTLDGDSPAPVFDMGGSPAGNIFSTTGDMGRYAQCQLRGGFAPDGTAVISPASLAEMWTPVGQRKAHGKVVSGYGLCLGTGALDGWPTVQHGGAVYGYASQMTLLPTAGLGVLVFATLDVANQIASRLANDGLRIALAERRMGKRPERSQRPPPIGAEQLASLPGAYRSDADGEVVEVVRREGRLYLMGDGVPLQIRPAGGSDFVIDGRLYGREADYPHMTLGFPGSDRLKWKGADWTRIEAAPDETPPPEIAPLLGEYGPDFNITYLTWSHGKLRCLIEYFYTHSCEPESADRYRMHGLLYEEEVLQTGVTDDQGRKGIRVGAMFLERRAG
jgi:D-alanyl-D-alanine dipeptidase